MRVRVRVPHQAGVVSSCLKVKNMITVLAREVILKLGFWFKYTISLAQMNERYRFQTLVYLTMVARLIRASQVYLSLYH
jgi:hypothetical protein